MLHNGILDSLDKYIILFIVSNLKILHDILYPILIQDLE